MGLGASWMFLCVGSRSHVVVPSSVTLPSQSMNFYSSLRIILLCHFLEFILLSCHAHVYFIQLLRLFTCILGCCSRVGSLLLPSWISLLVILLSMLSSLRQAKIHWAESEMAASEKGAVSRFTVSPFARYHQNQPTWLQFVEPRDPEQCLRQRFVPPTLNAQVAIYANQPMRHFAQCARSKSWLLILHQSSSKNPSSRPWVFLRNRK